VAELDDRGRDAADGLLAKVTAVARAEAIRAVAEKLNNVVEGGRLNWDMLTQWGHHLLDNGTEVPIRPKLDLVGFTVADVPAGDLTRVTGGPLQYGCDLGVPGTPLTQLGLWGHRVVEVPLVALTWKATGSPAAGSCVVDVLKAASLAAFEAGTYVSVCGTGNEPTIASNRGGSGTVTGVWTTETWAPGEVLVWRLVSVSGGLEVVSVQVGLQRA
jgi:hypothetical protein